MPIAACATVLIAGLAMELPAAGSVGNDKPLRPAQSERAKSVDFANDVAPILAKHCANCHGPAKQRGGLRLDSLAGLASGGDNGPVFVAGKAAQSDLVQRIARTVDPSKFMPPKGPALAAADVATIRLWIDQGAKASTRPMAAAKPQAAQRHPHWAFNPPVAVAPPKVAAAGWARNPIDQFVLAALESRGVKPSPEADRPTLIRRLYLDLLGLPPTPAEVATYLNDRAPGAYERLVDRVLASPHFGERWGRHWLDLARYADSDGYEKDLARPHAWRYRHWVIDAINNDLPFDRFTVEQLAGDLLPNATLEQKVATGFHRNTLTNREGGIDPEEDRNKRCVDRVGTTSAVWLGLTMQCCQCHTHKYDPLTQREFYGMFAFFNSGTEIDIPAPIPTEDAAYQKALAAHNVKKAKLESAMAAREPQLPAAMDEWETVVKAAGKVYGWTVLEPASFMSAAGAAMTKLQDRSIVVSGDVPAKDVYTVVMPAGLKRITAIRLEALTDWGLPQSGPGRSDSGNFVLTDFSLQISPREEPQKAKPVKLGTAAADYSQPGFDPQFAIDDKPMTGWAVADASAAQREPRTAVFTTAEDLPANANSVLTFTLKNLYGSKHVLGRFRLSVADVDRANVPGILPERIIEIFRVAKEKRTPEQQTILARYYRSIDPEMSRLSRQLAAAQSTAPQPPTTRAQTLAESPTPPKTYVHVRGDFLRKGPYVDPHTPAVLPPLKLASAENSAASAAAPTRLDLARWIVDPENPLTARVAVNHMWKNLFGRGIVASVDDFGTRGDKPTHPELLDWLARQLVADQWSRKAAIRRIVCSATYRQSSAARPELQEKDPKNLWLARQNRFRVEAEITRDLFLAVSGLLNPAIGGPSIRPPLPGDVAALGYGGVKWPESTGNDRYRRGMYIFFQRTVPYPMLMTFDTPDSNVSCSRRERSNTPLQALTLLNDPVFHECAVAFGKRMATSFNGSPQERIGLAFVTCFARRPTEFELKRLLQLQGQLRATLAKDMKSTQRLAGSDPSAVDIATYIAIARTLLNLDEFVTRE